MFATALLERRGALNAQDVYQALFPSAWQDIQWTLLTSEADDGRSLPRFVCCRKYSALFLYTIDTRVFC